LLVGAAERVPFHRERFRAAGFDPVAMNGAEDLARLPPMTKADVVGNRAALLSTAVREEDLVESRTGGTTGSPIVFLQARRTVTAKHAMELALRERMGWRLGDRAAWLWGAQQDAPPPPRGALGRVKQAIRRNLFDRNLFLRSANLTDEFLDEAIGRIERYRPRVVQAYPSVADLVARRLRAEGQRLHVPLVVLTAEPVLDAPRARVADAFGARALSFYGAREFGWIASECREAGRLHVNTMGVHVEAEPDGRLLVTDLGNDAMPLIRYEIGDRGRLDTAPCPCGDARPVLRALEGRIVDVFRLPSGREVPGVLCDIRSCFAAPGILDGQVVQRVPDRIEVLYVPGPGYAPKDLEALRGWLEGRFHGEATFSYRAVDRIPPGPNGKVRPCLCLLPSPSGGGGATGA
jgi:phenylacetate-CoA ligase